VIDIIREVSGPETINLNQNEYFALKANSGLVRPTNCGPYITKDKNSYLFNWLKYDKKIYTKVIVRINDIKECTLLDKVKNKPVDLFEWVKTFRKRA